MSSGDRGGGSGVFAEGSGDVGKVGEVRTMNGATVQDRLNPNRNKGFGSLRLETPSLSDMRAKQKAIVAKFMTFFQRKCSLVIEMYETPFYRQKPSWDRIAEFVYSDLCNSQDLRREVKDVQFHPVKMLLFVKFSEEKWRDAVVDRFQSTEGVTWSEYGVRVKGYSLDAQVKFVRLLGVSPETGEEEIKETFMELGIGEVIELKKGWLDVRRLPGVTNGTWALRVKILDPDKIIPSYIHRRDEGELWSLNFEGRIFCCWKCGSGTHIGDRCRDHTRTFEEIFNGSVSDENFEKPTWAAVVRSGQGVGDQEEVQRQKTREMEVKIKESNKKRDRERRDLEEQKRLEREEIERQNYLTNKERQEAIEKVKVNAQQQVNSKNDEMDEEDDDSLLLKASEGVNVSKSPVRGVDTGNDDNSLLLKSAEDTAETKETIEAAAELKARERALFTAIKHRSWLEQRSAEKLVNASINIELDRIFGPGASKLAIEFQPGNPEGGNGIEQDPGMEDDEMNIEDDSESSDEDAEDQSSGRKSSTPTRQGRGKKRNRRPGHSNVSISPIREPLSNMINDKKLKLDEDTEVSQDGGEKTADDTENGDFQEGALQTSDSNTDKSNWTSICEFWDLQASMDSNSNIDTEKEENLSQGVNVLSGTSEVRPKKRKRKSTGKKVADMLKD